MKVCICCSLTFTNEVQEIAKMLETLGYEVLLPNGVINRLTMQPNFDPVQAKIDTDSNHIHVDKIRESDAVLVCNFLKNCTPGYIGANTFAELFAANYFNKPIYALYPLPENDYIHDEIQSFGITVLNNNFNLLPPTSPAFAPQVPAAPSSLQSSMSPTTSSQTIREKVLAPEPTSLPPRPAPQTSTEPLTNTANSELPPSPNQDSQIPSAPIPKLPSTAAESANPTEPQPYSAISSESQNASHNPFKQVRDSWFSLWNKHHE